MLAVESPAHRLIKGFLFKKFCHQPWVMVGLHSDFIIFEIPIFTVIGSSYMIYNSQNRHLKYTILLRGNVALARKYLSSKQHSSIEFHVQICMQECSKRVLKINSSARFCMYTRTVHDSLSGRCK